MDDVLTVPNLRGPPNDVSTDVEPTASRWGRYVVVETVGKGGMGVVLRAYDPRLSREVALKLLLTEAIDNELVVRIVQEARAMAQLNHPNVVTVYDVELDAELGPVLVMEYVPGMTLRTWLEEVSRSKSEIIDVFSHAGRGLAAAHAKGILHRDFKPANVLIDRARRVKVTDFGLAKVIATDEQSTTGAAAEASLDDLSLTRDGVVMGTPRYMAPEQHRGSDVDARADQYSFCVALWGALTGGPPFTGSMKEMILDKNQGPPAWPSRVTVPRAVSEAIVRGLQPNRDDRWPSMDELLAVLQPRRSGRVAWGLALGAAVLTATFAAGQVSSEPTNDPCADTQEQLVGIWDDRRRAEVSSTFTASPRAYARELWDRLEPTLDDYAEDWHRRYGRACRAATAPSAGDDQQLALACLQRARLKLASGVDELLEADEETIPQAQKVVEGLPRLVMCEQIDSLRGQYDSPRPPSPSSQLDALLRLEAQVETKLRVGDSEGALALLDARGDPGLESAEHPRIELELDARRASALYRLGRYDKAIDAAQDVLRRALLLGHRRVAYDNALLLGYLRGAVLGQEGAAESYLVVARGLLDDGLDSATAIDVFRLEGLLARTSDPAASEASLRRAIELAEAHLGVGDPQLATLHGALGGTLSNAGKHAAAESEHRLSLQLLEAALGSDHPSVALGYNAFGLALMEAERHDVARQAFETSLTKMLASLPEGHPDLSMVYSNLGRLELIVSNLEGAEAHFVLALEIMQRSLPPEHPHLVSGLFHLGLVYLQQERFVSAEEHHRKALLLAESLYGPDDVMVARLRRSLAEVLRRGATDFDEAQVLLERNLEQHERTPLPPRQWAETLFEIARLMVDTNRDVDRARSLATEARAAASESLDTATVEMIDAWLADLPGPSTASSEARE